MRQYLGPGGPWFAPGKDEAIRVLNPGFQFRFVTAATLTIDKWADDGALIALNKATGIAVTLPTQPRVGFTVEFLVWVTIAGGSTTITTGDADELYYGSLESVDTDSSDVTVRHRADETNDRIITLNGGTTGGLIDTRIKLQALAPVSGGYTRWYCSGMNNGSGAVATPFS